MVSWRECLLQQSITAGYNGARREKGNAFDSVRGRPDVPAAGAYRTASPLTASPSTPVTLTCISELTGAEQRVTETGM